MTPKIDTFMERGPEKFYPLCAREHNPLNDRHEEERKILEDSHLSDDDLDKRYWVERDSLYNRHIAEWNIMEDKFRSEREILRNARSKVSR